MPLKSIKLLEARLFEIKFQIESERIALNKLLAEASHPSDQAGERNARQNLIHEHSTMLHELENQYHTLNASLNKLKKYRK